MLPFAGPFGFSSSSSVVVSSSDDVVEGVLGLLFDLPVRFLRFLLFSSSLDEADDNGDLRRVFLCSIVFAGCLSCWIFFELVVVVYSFLFSGFCSFQSVGFGSTPPGFCSFRSVRFESKPSGFCSFPSVRFESKPSGFCSFQSVRFESKPSGFCSFLVCSF